MKLTIIGHWGAYPNAGDATSAYLIEHDDYKLLIDCGSGAISQIQNFIQLSELHAVILSHYHHDHIADIGPLQYSRLIDRQLGRAANPLMIYGHMEDKAQFEKLASPPHTLSQAYEAKDLLQLGPFKISFLRTEHNAPCYAMRFQLGEKTIVYTADSSFFDSFISFAENADILLCETSFYANQDAKSYGHMNSLDAATIAKEANVKKLVLTHLPHFGNLPQLVEEAKTIFKGEIVLAEKGLIFDF